MCMHFYIHILSRKRKPIPPFLVTIILLKEGEETQGSIFKYLTLTVFKGPAHSWSTHRGVC